MAYKDEFVDVVKAIVSHSRKEGVEKITITWQQFAGGSGPLNHAVTVTYAREQNSS